MSSLESLRARIDGLDAEIVAALARRQEVVEELARIKVDEALGLRHPGREGELLRALEDQAAKAGLDPYLARRVFGEILRHSVRRQEELLLNRDNPGRSLDRPAVVTYQGGPNAYSHLAAQRHFAARPGPVTFVGCRTFSEAAEAVKAGNADAAVLPLENTTAGSINQTYELLARTPLAMIGEEVWRVEHCLIGLRGASPAQIRTVVSHPQALEQCSAYLQALPGCRIEGYFDTAEAVRKVAQDNDPAQAAVAGEEAAALHGLTVLARGIANQTENYTRFAVLAREPLVVDLRIPCKTSLLLATRDEKGALARCLQRMAEDGLNLTKLESRPRPGVPFEYLFYIDFEGNGAEPRTRAALDHLRTESVYLKVLGSYPARTQEKPAEARAAVPAVQAEAVQAPPAADIPIPPVPRSKAYRLAARAEHPDDTIVRVGTVLVGGDDFTVMAGPCSVESAGQIRAAAEHIKRHGGHILRGGVYKPRTSPYAFQGLGEEGLELLAEAGARCHLPVVTEVMEPAQVEPVARRADLLQIGARNMQNFNLLREVGKSHRPVLLKRGLSATIEEWLAAAEYILAQGNQQVILCERGIRTFETATRNTLDLSAIPVLRERTHLPVVVDPSHAAGNRRWVIPLAKAARACGAHGLLVEVHPDPDHALSDGEQSLALDQFTELMREIYRVPA